MNYVCLRSSLKIFWRTKYKTIKISKCLKLIQRWGSRKSPHPDWSKLNITHLCFLVHSQLFVSLASFSLFHLSLIQRYRQWCINLWETQSIARWQIPFIQSWSLDFGDFFPERKCWPFKDLLMCGRVYFGKSFMFNNTPSMTA